MSETWSEEVETVQDLARAEHLLVWAMRAIALGQEDCPVVVRTFQRACGAGGDQTLQAYTIFVKYLAMAARRRLQVHVPGCLCVGPDEAATVALIAAGQRSLRDRDETELRIALADNTALRADEPLVQVVRRIARLLAVNGLTLPDRRLRH
jgi:hypothetical protein